MATLTITSSQDFRDNVLINITDIVFNIPPSGGIGFARFDASQFDDTQVSSSVHISSSNSTPVDIIVLFTGATGFSAANWTFSSFSQGSVVILGSSSADI